jgi:hypothetical protein
MSNDLLKVDLVETFQKNGEMVFYHLLLSAGVKQLVKINLGNGGKSDRPDIQYLDLSERLLILYRQEGQDVHLALSKVFRRAAHKLYRLAHKKGLTRKSSRFLQLVM